MQSGRGHRVSIHKASFREIGIGVVNGSDVNVGPQLVTQDFGTPRGDPSFGTGVAFYDLNSNDFYDVGEGISGLKVVISGNGQSCLTADGGGWVVPIPSNQASRTVTFSDLGMNQTRTLTVSAGKNAKSDLKLIYMPPLITSANQGVAVELHHLEFSPVGGATEYLWQRRTMSPGGVNFCDTLENSTAAILEDYDVVNTAVKYGRERIVPFGDRGSQWQTNDSV